MSARKLLAPKLLTPFDKVGVSQKAACVINNHDHVLAYEFNLLPSGWRYGQPPRKNDRYSRSFVPSAITLMNAVLAYSY